MKYCVFRNVVKKKINAGITAGKIRKINTSQF